ncbi:hypothetical protein QR680_013431 [Steinernema hermaphroditum]|uniref:Uncharacterized protein n=1 Tax=Steinernema hermaphroditum TaxID=289476 RepID=A0AA39M2H6_9BILA|nr:hypothetical protein QR680_013431 [Steinernema hermaphroditum]
MRLTPLRLMQKFIRNKDHVFRDQKWARKDFLRTGATFIGVQVVLGVIIEEFAYPTPDIVYDLRCFGSPDFAAFAQDGKFGSFDPIVSNSIRSFKYSEGKVAEARRSATPNPYHES